MTTYASHLTNFNDVADAIRECSLLADDLAGSFPLRRDRLSAKITDRYDRFRRNRASAQLHGLGDEDNARRLLRDAVNIVNDLAIQAAMRGMRQDLAARANEVIKEFKPNYTRSYGFEVGDRVDYPLHGGGTVAGEIVKLDDLDDNVAILRTDDGTEIEVECEWCERLDAFDPAVLQASPTP